MKEIFPDIKDYNIVVPNKVACKNYLFDFDNKTHIGGKDDFTFIQIGGMNVIQNITEILKKIFGNNKSYYYIWNDMKLVKEKAKIVFENWKEETGSEIKR